MSLLDAAMETVVLLDRKTRPDGEGGYFIDWTEGARFKAAFAFDSSIEAQVGEVQAAASRYTITTKRSAMLRYHDVLRRLSDGKTFRVTSDGEDKFTPASAGLDMRQVTAEEWELPA